MRKLVVSLSLLILLSVMLLAWLSFSKTGKRTIALYGPKTSRTYKASPKELLKLQSKAISAKTFARQNHYDTSICFLIDMSLPANHKRFSIYDLRKDSVRNSGLVTHGNCNQLWLEGRKYANDIGCGCTSLGKYKIGNSYYGRFGLAFKLYGLEKTNSNAFKRYVVLHSHSCVPDKEVVDEICQSNGCPTVSPEFLKKLSVIIENAKQPVLLWIYE
jgi:hypothetical protein